MFFNPPGGEICQDLTVLRRDLDILMNTVLIPTIVQV